MKSWGTLPDDRLTLSGTTRLTPGAVPSLQTGPAVARIKVDPVIQIGIDAGRIDVQFDANLDDITGSLNRLEVAVARDFVVLSVESDALTDWSRPGPRQVVLRYDRPFTPFRRRLRITGWIPVPEDPLKNGSQPLELPTPWLEVAGMESTPAILTVSSPSRIQFRGASGLRLLPSAGPDQRQRQCRGRWSDSPDLSGGESLKTRYASVELGSPASERPDREPDHRPSRLGRMDRSTPLRCLRRCTRCDFPQAAHHLGSESPG